MSIGTRGCRVRLFQKQANGKFYREVFVSGQGPNRVSLETYDRVEAERLGMALYARLLTGSVEALPPAPVRLGELWQCFQRECPMYLDNKPHSRADADSRAEVLLGFFGPQRDVSTLTEHDVRQYEAKRRAGGIRCASGRVTPPVKQRSAQSDIKLLKQMLRWACTRTSANGQRWLASNPLEYVRVKGERDVQRPVATNERFAATRSAMRASQRHYAHIASTAKSAGERSRARFREFAWIRAEMGLLLLRETGRRRGAVIGLRWEDIDFERGRITWRAEHDKAGRTRVTPYAVELFAELRAFQRRLGAAGGPLFPKRGEPEASISPDQLSQWIAKAEKAAGLPKLSGGLCHPYRRLWRTERSHHPLKAVAEAGGWTDIETMLRSYDHPDEEDLLAVTSGPRRRGTGPQVVSA